MPSIIMNVRGRYVSHTPEKIHHSLEKYGRIFRVCVYVCVCVPLTISHNQKSKGNQKKAENVEKKNSIEKSNNVHIFNV